MRTVMGERAELEADVIDGGFAAITFSFPAVWEKKG